MLEHLIDFGMPLVPSVETLAKIIKKPSLTQKIKDAFKSILFIPNPIAESKSITEDLESLISSLENKSTLDAALMWKDTITKESPNNCLFEVV